MVQFNLLPDVKLEFMKARRAKRTTLVIASLVAIAALTIFVVLFVMVNVVQRQHLSNLDKDIKRDTAKLQAKPDLNKVLTVQNQLNTLTSLHQQTPATSRLSDYLTQLTPAKATISSVDIDFEASTLTMSGNADNLVTINKFVDTLKFTDYQLDGKTQKAFSEVVLGSFGRGETETSYTISLKFEAVIFDNTKQVKLVVPAIISTRSQTEKPSDLFKTNSGGTQ